MNRTSTLGALAEACMASHCRRFGKAFYFKGQGEVDVIWKKETNVTALEVKWSEQIRANDLKTLKQFPDSFILTKHPAHGVIENIHSLPAYEFLYQLGGVR